MVSPIIKFTRSNISITNDLFTKDTTLSKHNRRDTEGIENIERPVQVSGCFRSYEYSPSMAVWSNHCGKALCCYGRRACSFLCQLTCHACKVIFWGHHILRSSPRGDWKSSSSRFWETGWMLLIWLSLCPFCRNTSLGQNCLSCQCTSTSGQAAQWSNYHSRFAYPNSRWWPGSSVSEQNRTSYLTCSDKWTSSQSR